MPVRPASRRFISARSSAVAGLFAAAVAAGLPPAASAVVAPQAPAGGGEAVTPDVENTKYQ
ncbi:MAG: hypothetical protein JWO31_4102, partial [Phycisphaerales bacterium]|nr:hypothetical protein [Phycisphaerales bacterium]